MADPTEYRKNVISEITFTQLEEYLGFRHFFRHSYKFRLDWDKLERLVLNLESTWNNVKKDLESFF